MLNRRNCILILLLGFMVILVMPVMAATTQIHVVKYANDRSTILAEQTLTYQQMKDTLPVLGDGTTHYYLQGPVFVDDSNPTVQEAIRWNPQEDTNVQEKDMGAVKGTNVKDLCDIVGGMSPGDILMIKSSDGMVKEFAYKNIYTPTSRQGPIVITWYCVDSTFSTCTGPYPDSGYSDGMRLVFFADTSVNPWAIHAFGNYDWHESADPKDWYFYQSGGEKYPTTTGLSMKYVSEIQIYSTKSPGGSAPASSGGGGGLVLPASGAPPPENPLLYGYLGKKLSTFATGTLNGTLKIFSDPNMTPVLVNNRVRTFEIPVSIPPTASINLSRMYLYVSKSRGLQTDHGVIPSLYITLNGNPIENENVYVDTDGDDHKYVSATYAYDVRDQLKRNSTNTVSVRNIDHEQTVFSLDGVMLVTVYENETEPQTSFWINEGCDVVLSRPEDGLFPDDCTTTFPFPGNVNMSRARDADLYLVSTGYDQENTTEHTVLFNKGTWTNLFDNRTPVASLSLPVMEYLNETGNSVSVQSSINKNNAEYLVNRNAILVVEQQDTSYPFMIRQINSSGIVPSAPIPVAGNASRAADYNARYPVALDTEPEGALVYLDGLYLGKTTPYTLDLDKGTTHTVRFELDDYAPSETEISGTHSMSISRSLYTDVHSTKGRMTEDVFDPDGVRYGGLYVNSRPSGVTISLDGISTGKKSPSVLMGLKPGSHTIKVSLDSRDGAKSGGEEFTFEEQEVVVFSEVIVPVDINGIGFTRLSDLIVDSHLFRGISFTINGYPINVTIPAKVRSGYFDAFVTLHENNTFVSYPIPVPVDTDRYFLIPARESQKLSIAVDSVPRGAEVFIDGFRTGFATPYTFENISDGSHRVMVSKPGFLPQQRVINLPRRSVPIPQTPVKFVLEEYPSGILYVNSVPEGAEVSIDGLPSGEITPALFKSLPTGAHSIKVTGPNATKSFPDITINSLILTNITVDLNGFSDGD